MERMPLFHTQEVRGSRPCAPTIYQSLLLSEKRKLTTTVHEIVQKMDRLTFVVPEIPRSFAVVCQIFLRVPHQTYQYRPQKRVVEHKGLLRGCGLFSCQPFALVEFGSCTIRGCSCTLVHASVTSPDDDAIQSVKPIKAKTRGRGIRLDEPLIGRVEHAEKAGGFSNPSAFIRGAIHENWPDAKARWKPQRSELPPVSIASVVRSECCECRNANREE